MRDDFKALDFLSAGGFQFPGQKVTKKQKKRLGLGKRKAKAAAKRDLKALLPFFADKKAAALPYFEGWPVTLSWPRHDEIAVDHPEQRADFPHH
jgi:hypothetical protein